MQIQVNTDKNIQGKEAVAERVKSQIEDALERFGERITRVEVHLSDENSTAKAYGEDKRCVIEARLTNMRPVSVSHQAETLMQAVGGAVNKLEKLLTRTLERLDEQSRRK